VQIDTGGAVDVGGHRTQGGTQAVGEQGGGDVDDRGVQTSGAGGGGQLAADEPASDDGDPIPGVPEGPVDAVRVGQGAQHVNAFPVHRGPGQCPGGDARGEHQPVVSQDAAVSQGQLAGGGIQPSGGGTQTPGAVQLREGRQRQVPHAAFAGEQLLGQRGPVVGAVRLVADHGDRPAETSLPQAFGGGMPGQPRTHHDDMLKGVGHAFSTVMACIGHTRAACRT